MQFWESFWPGVWGALVGALVGASASWLFALDLHRRDRMARAADRRPEEALLEERPKREADVRYETTLNRQVGRLVLAMKRYESELGQLVLATSGVIPQASGGPLYGGAREAALTALLEAEFYTRGDDKQVLRAFRAGIDALPHSPESALAVGVLAQLLVTWRTERKTVGWAVAAMNSWVEAEGR